MTSAFLVVLALVFSAKTFAIYGNYIHPSLHPEQTCRLIMDDNSLCSGTLIESNVILTANHCLNDKAQNQHVVVTCGKQVVKGVKVELLGDANDLAKLTLDKAIIGIKPMQIANDKLLNLVKTNSTEKYFCGFFGYGVNNYFTTGTLHGIISRSSLVSKDKAFENQFDSRKLFKNLFTTLLAHPNLAFAKLAKINLTMLNEPILITEKAFVEKYNKLLTSENIMQVDFDYFQQEIMYQYMEAMTTMKADYFNNIENHFEYFESTSINTINPARGKSGVDNGDSGGTFACKVINPDVSFLLKDTKWVLFGVTSYKMMQQYTISQDEALITNLSGFASILNSQNRRLLNIQPHQISSATGLSNLKNEMQLFEDKFQYNLKYGTKVDNTSVKQAIIDKLPLP